MKVDRALEAFALRDPAHVHLVAGREAVDTDLLPGREPGDVVEPDLAQVLERRERPQMPEGPLGQTLFLRAAEPDLDRAVDVALFRPYLADDIRLRRAHRPAGA